MSKSPVIQSFPIAQKVQSYMFQLCSSTDVSCQTTPLEVPEETIDVCAGAVSDPKQIHAVRTAERMYPQEAGRARGTEIDGYPAAANYRQHVQVS